MSGPARTPPPDRFGHTPPPRRHIPDRLRRDPCPVEGVQRDHRILRDPLKGAGVEHPPEPRPRIGGQTLQPHHHPWPPVMGLRLHHQIKPGHLLRLGGQLCLEDSCRVTYRTSPTAASRSVGTRTGRRLGVIRLAKRSKTSIQNRRAASSAVAVIVRSDQVARRIPPSRVAARRYTRPDRRRRSAPARCRRAAAAFRARPG